MRTAEALDPGRIKLHIVHVHADGPLLERYRALGVPMRHLPLRTLLGAPFLRQGAVLARLLREWQVDVFHSHDIYGNIFGVPWARWAGVGAVVASRRWWDSTPRRSHRLVNRVAYQFAHYVTANSETVGMLLRGEGVPSSRIRIVPNFVASSAFEPVTQAERASARATFGIPREALLLGCVARLEPVKDHASVLRAVAAVEGRFPNVHLLLAGDGSQRSSLEELASQLGIRDRVHFLGQQPQSPNLYHLCDIAVLLSRSEGFPNTLVEAMAAGRPIVATSIGGIPDAVENGVTGLLVPTANLAKAAETLAILLSDASARDRLGANAMARARSAYAEAQVVEDLMAWYESLVRRPAAA